MACSSESSRWMLVKEVWVWVLVLVLVDGGMVHGLVCVCCCGEELIVLCVF